MVLLPAFGGPTKATLNPVLRNSPLLPKWIGQIRWLLKHLTNIWKFDFSGHDHTQEECNTRWFKLKIFKGSEAGTQAVNAILLVSCKLRFPFFPFPLHFSLSSPTVLVSSFLFLYISGPSFISRNFEIWKSQFGDWYSGFADKEGLDDSTFSKMIF